MVEIMAYSYLGLVIAVWGILLVCRITSKGE
jgi:hypothetical protein